MLYEQGRGEGAPIRRLGGEVVSYREAVHGQVLASWSNLRTLAANGEALRRDFVAHRLAQLAPPEGETRAWVVPAGDPSRRVEFLIDALRGQNIEVERLTAPRKARAAVSALGESRDELELPAGSFVVRLAQPQGALVRSYLDFDPRIDAATLADERARLERGEGSRLYDVTAWDLARQCDVAAWWCDLEAGDSEVLVQSPAAIGGLIAPDGMQVPWGFAVDGSDDQVLAFAARAMELGYVLHASDEPFLGAVGRGATRTFPRGSLLLRRHENPEALWGLAGSPLEGAAAQSGVQLFALESGRAPDLDHPDLGGGHFSLLHRPRVGLLCGEPLGQTDFGHTWHYLDQVLSMPVSLLGAGGLGGVDLRRYNVLVVPSGDTGEILQGNWQRLAAWVRGGGTLIAIGDSAAALAELDPALGDVRTRGAAIEELDKYQAAARRARAAGRTPIDEALVWGDAQPATEAAETAQGAASDGGEDAEPAPGSLAALDEDLAAADRLARRFMPAGAILRSECDAHSWLTFGLGEQLAVPYAGSTVLLSTGEVPVRLAPAERVRLAGLVWPEARERLADGAWLAREGMGNGQVLLFAQDPAYRGSWLGTARLLGNAVVFGPGLGARAPGQW
ncbi:MAG: hypothetical protein R3F17_09985 [Planctomycetota bacterium]